MPILLDNEPLSSPRLTANATIAQLIDSVRTNLAGTGRLIVRLRCDNEEMEPQQIESVLGEPTSRFDRLELITGRPEPFVVETLEVCQGVLADSFVTLRQAADALSAGRLAEAMGQLVECTAAWSQTHEAVVNSTQLLELDMESLRIAERPILEWVSDLAARLRDLKAAIEVRDFVLLGDLLRYELDETLQGWEEMLEGLVKHIAARS